MSSPNTIRRRPGGRCRPLSIEPLENRVYLSAQPVVAAPVFNVPPASALLAPSTPLQNATAAVQTLTSGAFSQAAESINDFALDLYQYYQQQPGNLFLSPMSIATALAMTYAGAEGQTAAQMADVLHLGQSSTVAASFHALLNMLSSDNGPQSVDLQIADALWPEQGFPFRQDFLQLIQSDYGGAAQSLNYADAAAARQTINTWVADQTNGKIQNLIPPGVLDAATRLVLTNAVYFKGQWATAFDPTMTSNQPFYLPSGQTVSAPLMYSDSQYAYTVQDGYQVLDLPYQGGKTSMVVLLPQNTTALGEVSGSTLEKVNDWLNTDPGKQQVIVRLPKFQMTVSSSLGEVLAGMGMPLAFDKANADFSGMASLSPDEHLYISQVLHKAFVQVDEQGTEAAAATAVIMEATDNCAGWEPPPIVFTANHAFQFYIRDNQTGTILFMGRVTDPTQQENNVTPTVGAGSGGGTNPIVIENPIRVPAPPVIHTAPVSLPVVIENPIRVPAPPVIPTRPVSLPCGPYSPWEIPVTTVKSPVSLPCGPYSPWEIPATTVKAPAAGPEHAMAIPASQVESAATIKLPTLQAPSEDALLAESDSGLLGDLTGKLSTVSAVVDPSYTDPAAVDPSDTDTSEGTESSDSSS